MSLEHIATDLRAAARRSVLGHTIALRTLWALELGVAALLLGRRGSPSVASPVVRVASLLATLDVALLALSSLLSQAHGDARQAARHLRVPAGGITATLLLTLLAPWSDLSP